ncbi:hypothetical protein ACFY0A_24210 [Streptomyces sp. NPDC001698]|uniref:hypothetical protein n=1 Tax=unclassified Streptomyces TaxID=2593676 RepID=UPI00368D8607
MPLTRQQALADGALEGKALLMLIGTTRDEATAFFVFDPRIQNLTTTTALEFATAVAEFVTVGTASDWLPYAPATAVHLRHFGWDRGPS